ncbi:GNAT family N-acetyltransferase [Pseudoduganella albidiflava]|nr:GNAT family N-acetyltransferase [Pseudoduganella albidiflava]
MSLLDWYHAHMSDRDEIFRQYFNQVDMTLELDESVDDDEFDVFNSVEMLVKLTGAPDGSYLKVSRGTDEAELFHIVVRNRIFKYPSEYALANRSDGFGLELYVDSITLRDEYQNKGIGPRSMLLSLLEAKAQGFRYVSLTAAGSSNNRGTFWGYYVWASMGFDAVLPSEILCSLPERLSHVRRLAELMLDDEGRQWWYHPGGRAIDVEFDLSPDSLSWTVLRNYVEAKGISYEY